MSVKSKQIDLFEIRSYKSLRDDEIVERICSISNQSSLLTWRLFAELSGRFKSKNAFGEYLRKWREDPESPLWGISSSTVTRYVQAGNFCHKMKITDLNAIGISKSIVYQLSEPKNADIAEKVFNRIKNKSLPIKEVERVIEQVSAVATIEHQPGSAPVPLQMSYDQLFMPKRTIEVIDGVAKEDESTEMVRTDEKEVIDPPQPDFTPFYQELERDETIVPVEDAEDYQDEIFEPHKPLTDDEMVDQALELYKSWRVPSMKGILVFTLARKLLSEKQYGKKLA